MEGRGKEISVGDVGDLLDQAGENFLIVDVRDEDFDERGHIKTAINMPSNTFHDEAMHTLVQMCVERSTQIVIFHCAYSKVRGPSCRDRFALFCQKEGLLAQMNPDIRLTYMKGGFTAFSAQFAGTEYVEAEV